MSEASHNLNRLLDKPGSEGTGVASALLGPGFLVPKRNGELLRWWLNQRLRVVAQTTPMTTGPYNEPTGDVYLPSIHNGEGLWRKGTK